MAKRQYIFAEVEGRVVGVGNLNGIGVPGVVDGVPRMCEAFGWLAIAQVKARPTRRI